MKKSDPKINAMVVMESLQKEAKPAMRKVSSLEIKSQADYVLAGTLMKQLKDVAKQAKEKEEELTGPLVKVINGIRDHFKPFRQSVKELEEDTKSKMLAFVQAQQRKVAKLEEDFEAGKIKKMSTLITKSTELALTDTGPTHVRRVWTAVPVNPELTPREYLMPDEAKIREALKNGKKVKGWKWEQQASISI